MLLLTLVRGNLSLFYKLLPIPFTLSSRSADWRTGCGGVFNLHILIADANSGMQSVLAISLLHLDIIITLDQGSGLHYLEHCFHWPQFPVPSLLRSSGCIQDDSEDRVPVLILSMFPIQIPALYSSKDIQFHVMCYIQHLMSWPLLFRSVSQFSTEDLCVPDMYSGVKLNRHRCKPTCLAEIGWKRRT